MLQFFLLNYNYTRTRFLENDADYDGSHRGFLVLKVIVISYIIISSAVYRLSLFAATVGVFVT